MVNIIFVFINIVMIMVNIIINNWYHDVLASSIPRWSSYLSSCLPLESPSLDFPGSSWVSWQLKNNLKVFLIVPSSVKLSLYLAALLSLQPLPENILKTFTFFLHHHVPPAEWFPPELKSLVSGTLMSVQFGGIFIAVRIISIFVRGHQFLTHRHLNPDVRRFFLASSMLWNP